MEFFLVPLSCIRLVLNKNWLFLEFVLLHHFKECFILTHSKNFQLMWVKMLSSKLFQVVLLVRKTFIMQISTLLTNKYTEIQHDIGCLILQAVNAKIVELVVPNQSLKISDQIWMLLLRQVLRNWHHNFYRSWLHIRVYFWLTHRRDHLLIRLLIILGLTRVWVHVW